MVIKSGTKLFPFIFILTYNKVIVYFSRFTSITPILIHSIQDYENFEAYICKAYKGNNRPGVCDGVALKMPKEKKSRNDVCHKNNVGLPDTMRIEMVI